MLLHWVSLPPCRTLYATTPPHPPPHTPHTGDTHHRPPPTVSALKLAGIRDEPLHILCIRLSVIGSVGSGRILRRLVSACICADCRTTSTTYGVVVTFVISSLGNESIRFRSHRQCLTLRQPHHQVFSHTAVVLVIVRFYHIPSLKRRVRQLYLQLVRVGRTGPLWSRRHCTQCSASIPHTQHITSHHITSHQINSHPLPGGLAYPGRCAVTTHLHPRGC